MIKLFHGSHAVLKTSWTLRTSCATSALRSSLCRSFSSGESSSSSPLGHISRLMDLPIAQGGYVVLDLRNDQSKGEGGSSSIAAATIYTVNITSAWQDHVDLTQYDSATCDVDVNSEGQALTILAGYGAGGQGAGTTANVIDITTPTSINIFIRACENSVLRLKINNKVEGDIKVACSDGDVSVDKARGVNVELNCGHAQVSSTGLIEGDTVLLSGSAIKAKKINGGLVTLTSSGSVDVSSMYVNTLAQLEAGGTVTVGLINGPITVHSKAGNVSLSNIDGWFDVHTEKGHVNLQVNKLCRLQRASYPLSTGAASAATSISQTGIKPTLGCKAVTDDGSLAISIDPEVRASVDAHCTSPAGRAVLTINSDTFHQYDKTAILTAKATKNGRDDMVMQPEKYHQQGYLSGASAASSRPTFMRSSGSGSGKIDLAAAVAQQSMGRESESVSAGAGDKSESSVLSTHSYSTNGSTNIHSYEEVSSKGYDLSLVAHGHVRLETLSWMEVIKRKHGFGGNDKVNAPVEAGRTATARLGLKARRDEANPMVGWR